MRTVAATESPKPVKHAKKAKIPAAVREQVWLAGCGRVYEAKCTIGWCKNKMTVHDFHCGHNVPESRGGATLLSNLVPICARCNLSMGNTYTIDAWKGVGVSAGAGAGAGAGEKQHAPVKVGSWKCCLFLKK